VLGGGDDTVLFTKNYVGSTSAWSPHTSDTEPTILAVGNAVRFQFESLVGGSVGNFLDDADFGVGVLDTAPDANAGIDQSVNEGQEVTLDASLSSDPEDDPLSYSWMQTVGTSVTLNDNTLESPSFTAPFVSAGGEEITFELTVDDGYGGMHTDQMLVHVQNANDPPNASLAQPTVVCLWPPNHKLVSVGISGVSDPDDNATITINGVTQDEVTNGLGDGDTAVDAIINDDGTVLLRAERSGTGDGRIYHIAFTASDLEGSSSGVVDVCVPHSKKSEAVDGGALYDSTQ